MGSIRYSVSFDAKDDITEKKQEEIEENLDSLLAERVDVFVFGKSLELTIYLSKDCFICKECGELSLVDDQYTCTTCWGSVLLHEEMDKYVLGHMLKLHMNFKFDKMEMKGV